MVAEKNNEAMETLTCLHSDKAVTAIGARSLFASARIV